jgi:two-component system NtrC family sensor kinase
MALENQETVLIIDDSLTVQVDLEDVFSQGGFLVDCCPTLKEARLLFAQKNFNLIILDMTLPDGNGLDFLKELVLTKGTQLAPVMILSNPKDLEGVLEGINAKDIVCVGKPYDRSSLLVQAQSLILRKDSHALPTLNPRKILTVDDSLTYLMALAEPLKQEGYDVIQASSGDQALELLKTQAVDCILLDLTMPGMSGQITCQKIKANEKLRHIPVIMLTESEDRQAMLDSLNTGADDYISKASELVVLIARMRAQLRRKQFEDENKRFREALVKKQVEGIEARANKELAETRGKLLRELEVANKELETFSYSVAHDLRAPIRGVNGFSNMLMEDYGDQIDEKGKNYIVRVQTACKKMSRIIDDLLTLARSGQGNLGVTDINLSEIAQSIGDNLKDTQPNWNGLFKVQEGIFAQGDAGLLRIVLENLLNNAWKYSSRSGQPSIEFGKMTPPSGPGPVFYVQDNGIGFDMKLSEKLFAPFQRLHTAVDFEGSGIGLFTVRRIISRHRGMIWAESKVGEGTKFFFTLNAASA